MALYGADRCMKMIEKLTEQAKSVLNEAFDDTEFLCELADSMVTRMG